MALSQSLDPKERELVLSTFKTLYRRSFDHLAFRHHKVCRSYYQQLSIVRASQVPDRALLPSDPNYVDEGHTF